MKQVASTVLLFLVCVIMPVTLAASVFGSGGGAVMLLVLTSLTLVFIVWADTILHRVFGARVIDSSKAPELVMVTDRLAHKYGIPRPRIALIDTAQANGLATRRTRPGGGGTILVSHALMRQLTRDEAEAVVALLIARLQRPEIRAAQVAATLGAMPTILASGAFLRAPRSKDRLPKLPARLLATLFAPIGATLVRTIAGAPLSFAADRDAAGVLDNPLALARALTRLDGLARATENGDAERHPATGHMFLVDPLHPSRAKALFDSQPPVDARVAHLKRLAGMDDA